MVLRASGGRLRPIESLGSAGQFRRLRRVARLALEAYDLGGTDATGGAPGLRLVPLTHLENTTFRVDVDGQRYLLRIHRPGRKADAEVRSELAWLAALRRDTHLGVPEPVPTRDGRWLVAVEGAGVGVPGRRPCAVFRWVEGRFARADRVREPALARLGAFAGRLHRHSERFRPPAGFVRWRMDADWVQREAGGVLAAGARAGFSSADQAALRAAAEAGLAAMAALGEGPDAFGLLHGDLHLANVLFAGGEARAIDFDDCGWGHYLAELAVTLETLAHRADFPALRAALLAGYRSVRPLPAALEGHLPAFVALRRLVLLGWLLKNLDHPGFRPWVWDEVANHLRRLRPAETHL